MLSSTYFLQECPTCGRRSQIRVEYLGKRLVCRHCHGQFVATDPASQRFAESGAPNPLLRRADELLQVIAERSAPPRVPYPR